MLFTPLSNSNGTMELYFSSNLATQTKIILDLSAEDVVMKIQTQAKPGPTAKKPFIFSQHSSFPAARLLTSFLGPGEVWSSLVVWGFSFSALPPKTSSLCKDVPEKTGRCRPLTTRPLILRKEYAGADTQGGQPISTLRVGAGRVMPHQRGPRWPECGRIMQVIGELVPEGLIGACGPSARIKGESGKF